MEKHPPTISFSPAQIASALGVSESSLKRWCDQGLLEVNRTPGGHRKITLQSLMQYLRREKVSLLRPELLRLPSNIDDALSTARHATQLETALICGNYEGIRSLVLGLYIGGYALADLADDIISPSFETIGECWASSELEVFQERRACELMLRVLHELMTYLPKADSCAPVAIGGTLEGDYYQIPTLLVEIVLRDLGWNAQSLGSGHPGSTLVAAAQEHRPRLFWLSVSHVEDSAMLQSSCDQLEAQLSSAGGALVLGGRALNDQLREPLHYTAHCDQLKNLESFAKTLWAEKPTN